MAGQPGGIPKTATIVWHMRPMTAPKSDTPDPRFAERVARIKARRAKACPALVRKRGGGRRYALSLLGAFAVGCLVVVAARYARFHLTGALPGASPLKGGTLLADMGLAFVAGLLLQQAFRFRRPEHTGAKTFGMVVAIFTMHMAVHAAPGLFEPVFSADWVAQVIRLTDPTKIAVF